MAMPSSMCQWNGVRCHARSQHAAVPTPRTAATTCGFARARGLQPRYLNTHHNRAKGSSTPAAGGNGFVGAASVLELGQQTRPAEAQTLERDGAYNWSEQWYPVAVAADLDASKPWAHQLLGRKLVSWRDVHGQWRTFEDACPHRLAPLSEGRIEESDGSLMCSYHGWRFDGEGRCTSIPQADDEKAEATACSSSRSAAITYPTQVQQGMLWVWGQSGSDAFIHSAAKPPMPMPQCDLPEGTKLFNPAKVYMRELHYDYTTLVENFLDPGHVPYAHHGVLGSRYSETAGFLKIRPTEGFDTSQGAFSYDVDLKFNPKMQVTTKIQFHPPHYVRYYTPRPDGTWGCMNLLCIPTAPGKSRVTYSLYSTADSKFSRIGHMLPTWLCHRSRNAVFDGDHVFLHLLDRILDSRQRQGQPWAKAYYMPAQADKIVTAWRQWLDSNGGPVWAEGVSPALPPEESRREVVLDRYSQHTQHCKACLKALMGFRIARAAAAAAGIAAVLGGVLMLGRGAPLLSRAPLLLAAGAVACAALWRLASKQVEQFYFVDYVHAERK